MQASPGSPRGGQRQAVGTGPSGSSIGLAHTYVAPFAAQNPEAAYSWWHKDELVSNPAEVHHP
jgi:hypothetical protein